MTKVNETKLNSMQWRILIVLAFVQFLHIVDFMILMPLGPQLMRQFALETDEFGYLVAAYSFSAAIVGVLASSFVNKFDRKLALATLLACFLMATVSCAFANSFVSLLMGRVLAGACGGLLGAQCFAILGDTIPAANRGFATGILMAAFSLASVLGVPIGLAIASKTNWQAPFLALGLTGAPLVLCVQMYFPNLKTHLQNKPKTPQSTWQEIRDTILAPGHLSGFALTFCVMMSGFVVVPYLSPFFVRNRGVAESELPLIYFCGGLATFVTGPLIGKIVDRYGAQSLLNQLVLLALVPIFAITGLDVWHPQDMALSVQLAFTTVFMILVSGRMVPMMTLLNQKIDPERRGGFLSINSSVQMLAAGLGASLGGLLLGSTSDPMAPLPSYERVGAASALFAIIALYFIHKFVRSNKTTQA